jgi:hypothetical protein
VNIRFHCINPTRDRRSPDLKARGESLEHAFATFGARRVSEARQEAQDAALESEWRKRVRDNVLGLRGRKILKLPALFRRQAS